MKYVNTSQFENFYRVDYTIFSDISGRKEDFQ